MSNPRHIHNIALIGFMGVGKSTVGRLVAEQLRFPFVDTDDLIEARAGCSVSDIFARDGEPAFRALEREIVAELAQKQGLVIATGGGLVCDPLNLLNLRSHALTVCLWATPETIWRRVHTQTHRPLLQTPDPLAKIRELLAQRGPAYRQADVLLGAELRSPKEVAQQVLYHFQLARKSHP